MNLSPHTLLWAAVAVSSVLYGAGAARAQPADAPPADAPKLALIVVGDPDTSLRSAAARVRTTLVEVARFPSDSALEAALLGSPEREDGLARIRAERRSLGLSEAADVPTLTRVGQLTSSELVLLVRTERGSPHLVAFHVAGQAFVTGSLPVSDASDAQIQRFVLNRVSAPGATPRTEAETDAPPSTPAEPDASPAVVALPTIDPSAVEGDDTEEEASWFEKHWPLLAGGALLLGVLVWFAWPDSDENASPTLRFVPGGP